MKQIGLPLCRQILIITRMIADRIGLDSVLLPLLIVLMVKIMCILTNVIGEFLLTELLATIHVTTKLTDN